MLGLVVCNGNGMISAIFRRFAGLFVATEVTQKRFYTFVNSGKIESGFKEIKHEIGAVDSQCRNENAVENHFNLSCLAVTLTWVYALKQADAPKRRHPNRNTGAFAFADVRRKIAAELEGTPIFHKGCPEPVKRAIKYVRNALFRPAA